MAQLAERIGVFDRRSAPVSRRSRVTEPQASHAISQSRVGAPIRSRVASPVSGGVTTEDRISESVSKTGLPPRLRTGVEALSGFAMDDVRVHRNSSEPAKLGALAFTRGTEIHLGPGQEEHLPHEAWHVVQQKQGRVAATEQLRGQSLNCDAGLEAEADQMGRIASEGLHSPGQPIDQAALAFGAGPCAPGTASSHRPLAHELAHSDRQGFGTNLRAPRYSETGQVLQRQAITLDLASTAEDIRMRIQSGPGLPVALRNQLQDLLDKKVTSYTDYRDAIDKATAAERRFALERRPLLTAMLDALGMMSFARLVERLGRRAPTFEELRSNRVVAEAIKDAWLASDIGKKDLVTQAHEEGGWVFMNIIDGSLSIQRAKPEGTNFIKVEPPPDAPIGYVLVAIFHTHPTIGRRLTAFPSTHDRAQDQRRGVPNLVAGNLGTKSDVFQVRLSGPNQRKHLASDKKIPGPSGGIAP